MGPSQNSEPKSRRPRWTMVASCPRRRCGAWRVNAQVIPAILNGPGQVLDVGRERRLFTGTLRRALVLRDKGCAFPGCDRPPRWTEAHHVRNWLDFGVTAPTQRGPAMPVAPPPHPPRRLARSTSKTGTPIFIPPAYIDKTREPIPRQPPPQDNEPAAPPGLGPRFRDRRTGACPCSQPSSGRTAVHAS